MPPQKNRKEKNDSLKNKLGMEGRIPTMPAVYHRNFKILYTTGTPQATTSRVEYITTRPITCPQCRSRTLKLYDHYWRKAAFINHEGVRRTLLIKAKRYKCQRCSHLFREPMEGLLPKKRSSEQYRQMIAHEYCKNVNNKTIAREFGLSQSTVERIIHERFHLKIKEALNYPAPLMIGIDEHTIHKGRTFATTIADLGNHRIYDIIEGKSLTQIERNLKRYKNRDKVQMVCMDLSSSYRNIVRKCFPNAKIVADRFHVIRMIQHHFMEFCKQAQQTIRWQRPIIHPLRKKACNLTPREKQTLHQLFELNPAIHACHTFKEQLCDLLRLKTQNIKQCRNNLRKLKEMMDLLTHHAPAEMKKIGITIRKWFTPIIRMWRFVQNNGITEGFHRKMKLIQRRAYGYRNFQNYRLRVLVECGGFNQ